MFALGSFLSLLQSVPVEQRKGDGSGIDLLGELIRRKVRLTHGTGHLCHLCKSLLLLIVILGCRSRTSSSITEIG
jgi:hypothetical protein